MKNKLILFLLSLPLLQAAAQMPDATGIMNRVRELTLTGSLNANVSLTITEKSGSTRSRTIAMTTKSYTDGTEKRIIRFVEPADVRGTAMLIIDNKDKPDEMWIYLPALKKTRRIVSSEKGKSFMSSEFSNSDFSSPTMSDFTSRHLETSGKDNLWIIESTPADKDKENEYGYLRKVTYIASNDYQLKKIEFYNFDNILFKVIEVKSVQPGSNGAYIIRDMEAKNLLSGRSSEIRFSNIQMNQKTEDSTFTLQNLEK